MADLNQAIYMAPGYAPCYFIRGLVRHAQGDGTGASSDFQTSADKGFYKGAFWLWIVKMEASDRGIASQQLSDYAAQPGFFRNDAWAALIADFLLGKITQNQLMAKTQVVSVTNDRIGEAWFYAGMVKIFSGDIKGAQDCFQKSMATQANGSEEVIEAQRELTKLQPTGL
jgi:lipoprotein NlpI